MKHLMRFVALGALLCASAFSQETWFSSSTGVVSLSGAGATFTIQQVTGGAKRINLDTATVYCSVTCTITQAQNGTAATATAGTVTALNPNGGARAQATVFTASNVGAGTAVGTPLVLAAGETRVIDLSRIVLPTGSSGLNYSITVSSITGNYSIGVIHKEQ
jgi:hypothetical protein